MMSKTQQTIMKVDMFSLPFQFNLDTDQKQKKTFLGGIMTLSILSLSFAYLLYLCYLYFSNLIQPSIAITKVDNTTAYNMTLDSSFLSAGIVLPNGQSLHDYQMNEGKIYLQLISAVNISGTQSKIQFYPLIPCTDPKLDGQMCLDLQSLGGNSEGYDLLYSPKNHLFNNIHIIFSYCQQAFLQNGQTCATPAETNNLLLTFSTQVQLNLNLTQYNSKTMRFENRIKQEVLFFDSFLAFYSKFQLQKYDVSVNQGFIIQSQDDTTFFGDYIRVDNVSSQTFCNSQLGMNVLGAISFFIQQESTNIVYQFPQFTFVLAQFTSVFNTLLSLGFFCKLISMAEIFHQVIDQQLKVYFQGSRLSLIERYGDQKELSKAKKDGPLSLWNYIQNIDIRKLVSQKLNVNALVRLKLILFGDVKDSSTKTQTKKFDEKKILHSLHDISEKAINVFVLQKEILQIKMILKLILSVEQYAAIQLCGCRVPNQIDFFREKQRMNQSLNGINENMQQNTKYVTQNNIQTQQINIELNQLNNNTNNNDNNNHNYNENNNNNNNNNKNNNQNSDNIIPPTIEIDQIQFLSENRISMNQDQQKINECKVIENFALNHIEQLDRVDRDEDYLKNCVTRYLSTPDKETELDKRIIDCIIGAHPSQSLLQDNIYSA